MFVDLYTDNLYSSKIRIQDSRIAAEYTGSVSSMTIGDVTYKYVDGGIITSLISDVSGSMIANCVTDPAGSSNTYRYYYLRGGMHIRVRAYYYPDGIDTWRYVMSVGLFVDTTQLCEYGITTYTNTDPATKAEDYSIRFVSIEKGTDILYGFAFTDDPSSYIIVTAASENFYNQSRAKPYDGGASGSDPSGGYGDNDTESDLIPRIGSLSGVLANADGHGLHVYEMDLSAYSDFLDKLYSKYILMSLARTFLSPEDALVSLHMLPTLTRSQSLVSSINVGALFAVPLSGTVKADSQNVYTIDSGEIPVGTVLNDFLDYADTKAALYLPFCGYAPIDIQDIMDGAVRVIYEIDVIQGNCCANVYTYNYQNREKLQGVYAGNCAYRIPLTGSKDGSGLITGLITTAAGAAIGKVDTALSGGLAVANSLQSMMGSNVWSSGQIGSNSAYYSDPSCQLIIYRPNGIYPDTYAAMQGRPTGDGLTVGRYSGFLSGIVHADMSAATPAEKQDIEKMFREGVII